MNALLADTTFTSMLPAWVAQAIPWVSLGSVTIVMIVALRARWKSTTVLTRCVVFSLYAHFLLATIAYTTAFMPSFRDLGLHGPGSGEVRVKVSFEEPTEDFAVSDVPTEPVEAYSVAKAHKTTSETESVEPAKTDIVSKPKIPEPEITTPKVTEPEATQEIAESPPVEPSETPTEVAPPNPLDIVKQVPAEVAPRYSESVSAPPLPAEVDGSSSMTMPRTPTPPLKVPREVQRYEQAPPLPEIYRSRFSDDRVQAIEQGGGSESTEASVQAALAWLVGNQESDGRWSAARHEAGRENPRLGQNRGGTGADADTGITALALLALLGDGQTHLAGEHRVAIQHGLEFLLASQADNGSLAGEAKLFASMYCHGMATLALAEAMALSGDPRLRPFVEKAVAYSVAAQHSGGGWRYQPGDLGDMSQFGWQLMALKSAEVAGVKVPQLTKDRMHRFLDSVSSGRAKGLAAYRSVERPSRTMTAEALLCRHLLAESPNPTTVSEATTFILQELPSQGDANVYYWYYGTLAMRMTGGAGWQRWNEKLKTQILGSQRTTGVFLGSWDPDKTWGSYGGRVYQTSLSALCLESYYRYDVAALEQPAKESRWR